MLFKPYRKIIKFLEDNNVPYREISHEMSSIGSSDASSSGLLSEFSPKKVVRPFLLREKNEESYLLVVIKEENEIDFGKIRNLFDMDVRFAREGETKEVMGCSPDFCFPFGNIVNLPTYVNEALFENKTIYFSPGLPNVVIKMKWEDYKELVQPQIVDIATEQKSRGFI